MIKQAEANYRKQHDLLVEAYQDVYRKIFEECGWHVEPKDPQHYNPFGPMLIINPRTLKKYRAFVNPAIRQGISIREENSWRKVYRGWTEKSLLKRFIYV